MHNGPDSLLSTVKFQKKPELAILEKPFKITYENGKVNNPSLQSFRLYKIIKKIDESKQITGFDADSTDAEWSINIKKGLATKLQVDLSAGENFGKGDNAFLRTIEDTIMGKCNTSYSFGGAEKNRVTLIKQRSAADCPNVPRMSYNTFEAKNCAGKFQDELISTTQTYYQFTRQSENTFKAQVISSMGYQILQWHPPAGTPYFNLAKYFFLNSASSNDTLLTKLFSILQHHLVLEEFRSHFQAHFDRFSDQALLQPPLRSQAPHSYPRGGQFGPRGGLFPSGRAPAPADPPHQGKFIK